MDDIKKKLDRQFEIVTKGAKDIIENAEQYSQEELADLRKTIAGVIQNAEAKLKGYKAKKEKKAMESS